MMWWALVTAAIGCYLLKLLGLSVPPRVREHPFVAQVTMLIPVAFLSALIAVQVLSDGDGLQLDARLAGLGFAVIALLMRAPFLVVVFGAAAAAALLRAV
jgi:branched-subunit amino acid transport protein